MKRGRIAWILLAALVAASHSPVLESGHRIEVSHPARNDGKTFSAELVGMAGGTGTNAAYYLDVGSVICVDDKCEIIPVRIFWDAIGRYIRYELPAGGELTKKGHEPFTRTDREELHRILADRDSPLRWVSADRIVPPEKALERIGEEEVDGVSGATALSEEGTVVKGAAYTCHTLWHWAQGEVCGEIRRITGRAATRDDLLDFLRSGDDALVVFALDRVTDRKIDAAELLEAATAILEQDGETTFKRALDCIESISAAGQEDRYFQAVERLFPSAGTQKRILFLKSLAATRLTAPPGFYDRICRSLGEMETYFEIHLLLNLMENRNPGSAEVAKQAAFLLDESNFLIARRAYEFLKDRSLDPSRRAQVEAFRAKYAERL